MKLLLIATIFAATALAGDPFPTRIPDRLSVCYANKTISDRYRRMPASLENLVAIIRKVEAHPDTALWTIGKMASTLIHRFRYDGIVDMKNAGPDIVPITTERVESDKFRLQWKLVPGTASDFPETSLTQEEKCSLHWMLSYTVNHTTVRAAPMSRTFPQPREYLEEDYTEIEVAESRTKGIINETETESFPDQGDEEKLGENLIYPELNAGSTEEENKEDNSSFQRRKRQTNSASLQLLEGGVIQTKYGTVAAGPLLMGIAAGSESQSVQLESLIKNPQIQLTLQSMERIAHSIWVATLAGDIAQTSLLKTPYQKPTTGPRGQWNSSFCPREFNLESADHSMLTNAEFYGGLDGLLMALRIRNWDVISYLKISSVLEMYYSESGIHGDSNYRACNRINNYRNASVIDPTLLKQQSLNTALVMYSRGIDGAPSVKPGLTPADQIGQYVNATLNEIEKFISNTVALNKDFNQCKGVYVETTAEPTPATYTDLTFVFDQSTDSATLQNQKNSDRWLSRWTSKLVGVEWKPFLSKKFQTMYGVARYCVSTTKERPGTGDTCKTAQKDIGVSNKSR